jgi:hypothetical protein
VLVGAVLLGILLMHGGLGTHLGAGMTMEPRAGIAPASGQVGTASSAPAPSVAGAMDPAEHAGQDLSLAGAAVTLRAGPGHDGHVGELCLAVLRSVALFAGLLLALLLVGARRDGTRLGQLTADRGRLRYLSPPTAPLLSSLCVLRL